MVPSPSSLMCNHFKFSEFFLEMPFDPDPSMPFCSHSLVPPSLHPLPGLWKQPPSPPPAQASLYLSQCGRPCLLIKQVPASPLALQVSACAAQYSIH